MTVTRDDPQCLVYGVMCWAGQHVIILTQGTTTTAATHHVTETQKTQRCHFTMMCHKNSQNKCNQYRQAKKIFCLISLFIPKVFTSVKKENIKEYQNNVSPELLQTVFSPLLGFCCPPTEDKSVDASIYFGGKFKPEPHRAEMALAATRLPSGRVRSVIASTTLGLARAGSFTNS